MALDMFMTANDHFLFINDNDMYQLSKDTVEANMKGIKADALLAQIATRIESESMPFGGLVTEEALKQFPRGAELHAMIVSERDNIRLHPLNSEESKI